MCKINKYFSIIMNVLVFALHHTKSVPHCSPKCTTPHSDKTAQESSGCLRCSFLFHIVFIKWQARAGMSSPLSSLWKALISIDLPACPWEQKKLWRWKLPRLLSPTDMHPCAYTYIHVHNVSLPRPLNFTSAEVRGTSWGKKVNGKKWVCGVGMFKRMAIKAF